MDNPSNFNSYDFLCRDCFKHVPKEFIERLIREAKREPDDKFARGINAMCDLMVLVQRCPPCAIKVFDSFEKIQKKRKRRIWGYK